MSLCYICNTHQGKVCKIPYINLDDESVGVTNLLFCGGCWQKVGKTINFPMNVDPMLIAMSVAEDHLVASLLKWAILNFDSIIPEFQEFPHPLHPDFIGRCHKCHHQHGFERQIPWKKEGCFAMFETVLCQDCWKKLVLTPGSMPFRGDTWWDAFQDLKEIEFYEDLIEEEEGWEEDILEEEVKVEFWSAP